MFNYRSIAVWGVGIAVVLVPFFGFVLLGWPGEVDSCTTTSPDSCFCERFALGDVTATTPGIRQLSNTVFNLYAVGTSLIVALRLGFDRRSASAVPIKSTSWIPDVYVFAVAFLGLGSMWFHASIKGWAGNVDGMSMYVYAAFLVFYTAYRLWPNTLFFAILYPLTVAAFTVVGVFWQWHLKSLVLILILVAAYLALETACCVRDKAFMMGRPLPIALWSGAVASIITATIFWALSQTGGPLCDPDSLLQPHGLLWHPLAGVMAVLLYFYWREERRV